MKTHANSKTSKRGRVKLMQSNITKYYEFSAEVVWSIGMALVTQCVRVTGSWDLSSHALESRNMVKAEYSNIKSERCCILLIVTKEIAILTRTTRQ